jgi:hypothetical protein
MHKARRDLWIINVLGGVAVLGSYAIWLGGAEDPGALWGEVPESWVGAYTANMLAAAAGYFGFAHFLFLRADPDTTRFAGRWTLAHLRWVFLAILGPSALWMPLTFAYLEAPSAALYGAIHLTLYAVGLGSVALLAALLTARPRAPGWAWALAVVGAIFFTAQTGVLDALVWTHFFPAIH